MCFNTSLWLIHIYIYVRIAFRLLNNRSSELLYRIIACDARRVCKLSSDFARLIVETGPRQWAALRVLKSTLIWQARSFIDFPRSSGVEGCVKKKKKKPKFSDVSIRRDLPKSCEINCVIGSWQIGLKFTKLFYVLKKVFTLRGVSVIAKICLISKLWEECWLFSLRARVLIKKNLVSTAKSLFIFITTYLWTYVFVYKIFA